MQKKITARTIYPPTPSTRPSTPSTRPPHTIAAAADRRPPTPSAAAVRARPTPPWPSQRRASKHPVYSPTHLVYSPATSDRRPRGSPPSHPVRRRRPTPSDTAVAVPTACVAASHCHHPPPGREGPDVPRRLRTTLPTPRRGSCQTSGRWLVVHVAGC